MFLLVIDVWSPRLPFQNSGDGLRSFTDGEDDEDREDHEEDEDADDAEEYQEDVAMGVSGGTSPARAREEFFCCLAPPW